MTDRLRPGDDSLPLEAQDRLSADVVTIGSDWHQPARADDPQPPCVGPDQPHALAGASESARAELEAAFGAGFTHTAARDSARRDSGKPGAKQAGGLTAGG